MSPYMISHPHTDKPELDLEEFEVTRHGFLPSEQPLAHLPNSYYEPWESLARDLPQLIKSRTIREEIRRLPILSRGKLHNEEEWRRAYVVLAFLTHAYVWGDDHPAQVRSLYSTSTCAKVVQILPACLAIPFTSVSEHFELPPVATYAALCLWNYQHTDSQDLDFEDCDALRMMHNITGTEDEAWFYLISVMVEGQGARSIPLMVDAIRAADQEDYRFVIESLHELRNIINHLGKLLERMYERCAPGVFYHEIRPVLAGSKNMAAAGLPRGIFFDFGNGQGDWKQLRGGSNAQSSLIQFFDAVLGVVHRSTGDLTNNGSKRDVPFHEEMRQYMPGTHRRFLDRVTKMANLRELALRQSSHPLQSELREAFQNAVQALSDFRGIHMQIVARYIIIPSRQASVPGRLNLAVASQAERNDSKSLTGTGGTDLIPFLKQTREETDRAGNQE